MNERSRFPFPRKAVGIAVSGGFIGCIVGANWLLVRYGMVSVGFGLTATAGTYLAGLSFGLRDAVQELSGRRWTVALIALGAALSAFIDPTYALASGVAFGCSEFTDFAIYTPLRERRWVGAVVASNLAGAVADSALFLWIAFGSIEAMAGQVIGKMWMTAPAVIVVGLVRGRR